MCRPLYHYPPFLHNSLPNKSDLLAAPNQPRTLLFLLFLFLLFGLRKTKRNQSDGFVTLCQSNCEPFHSWNLKFDGSTITEIGNLVFKVQGGLHLILPICFALHWLVEPKYYTFFLILPFFKIKSSI